MKYVFAAMLGVAICAPAATIDFDGRLDEWTTSNSASISTEKDINYGEYTLYMTEDAATAYCGLERSQVNKRDASEVVMIAMDIDCIAGSGSDTDYYGNISFQSSYLPDFILYACSDGSDTFQYAVWDNDRWVISPDKRNFFLGSSSLAQVCSTELETEYAIDLDALGRSSIVGLRIWVAGLGDLKSNTVNFGWGVGNDGIALGEGYVQVPEPATLALLGLGGLLARRNRKS